MHGVITDKNHVDCGPDQIRRVKCYGSVLEEMGLLINDHNIG